jgi:hypothetical protein
MVLRTARVGFAPLGCVSANHHPIGVDRNIRSASVLEKMESALASRSHDSVGLIQWFASFLPGEAELIIDPLILETTDPMPVKVEVGSEVAAQGYLGGYFPPPPSTVLPTGLSSTLPNLMAAEFLPAPPDALSCAADKLIEKSAGKRFGHPATLFLFLGWLFLLVYQANPAVTWFGRFREMKDTLADSMILFLPVIISRWDWGSCLWGCDLEPGKALPVWCGLYGLIAIIAKHKVRKQHWLKYSGSVAILAAALLFGLANFRIAAAPEILTFCDAFSGSK